MFSRIFILLASVAAAAAYPAPEFYPFQNVQACTNFTLNFYGVDPLTIEVLAASDTGASSPLETFTGLVDSYTWNVKEAANTQVYLLLTDYFGYTARSSIFTIQPSSACPTTTTTSGPTDTTTATTTDTAPSGSATCSQYISANPNAQSSCSSGDTVLALSTSSSCAGLVDQYGTTVDQLYGLADSNICCDSIAAGTTVCQIGDPSTTTTTTTATSTTTTTAAPSGTCATFVPTNAAATSSCLADDRSVTLPSDSTCDLITSFLNITVEDLYSISGSTICCDSIPSGTTICVPTPSSSSCPTVTADPTTTTATATATTTATTSTTSAPTSPTNLSGYQDWTYLNCYVDSVNDRQLPVPMGIDDMTVEKCLDACSGSGFAYAGVEYSGECYCGQTVPPTLATDGRCDMTCDGNSLEICGGGDGLSVYYVAPSILQSYNSWTYNGCYEDSIADRTMPYTVTTISTDSMTVEKCLDACHSSGYHYAGVEWSQECYCAQALPPTPATDGTCDMACKGNGNEICGGGNGLTVYSHSYTPRRRGL